MSHLPNTHPVPASRYTHDMHVIDKRVDQTPFEEILGIGTIIQNAFDHPAGSPNIRHGRIAGYTRWYEGEFTLGSRLYLCRYIDKPGTFYVPVDGGNISVVSTPQGESP